MRPSTLRTVALALAFTVVGATATVFLQNADIPSPLPSASAQTGALRHFDLEIRPSDIDMGEGALWHAWTLTATVGDVIEVIMMAERGFDASGKAPYFIINGKAMPGGEHHLEEVFLEHGIEGVKAHLGATIPLLTGKVGEPARINVVNIGDAVHTFHMHAMTAYDPATGRPVPAQVLGLTPGEVGRFVVTPAQPGIWLFHCHVVNHADAGMIGVFVVEP